MSVKWHRFCCCACVCYSSLSPCTTLPFNHSSIQCVYDTQQPDNFCRKFIQMGKGHRKNDMPKTFRRIQLEFQISKHSENWSDAQDAAAAAKQMQKKKERKKKRIQHLTSTLYSSGILPVINAIFSHENVWRFLSHSRLLFRWQSVFSAVFFLPVNFFGFFSVRKESATTPSRDFFVQ